MSQYFTLKSTELILTELANTKQLSWFRLIRDVEMKGGELEPPVYGVIRWLRQDGYIAAAGPAHDPHSHYRITQQGHSLLKELRSQ